MKYILHLLAMVGFLILSLSSFSQVTFDKHSITTSFSNGVEVCPADINDDGHMDFVAAGGTAGGQIAWWENDGYQHFEKHLVEISLDGIRSSRAVDLDQDGDMDIVGCTAFDNEVIWWENDGDESFTSHFVDSNFTGGHTVAIYDMNGDNYLDVLCCGFVTSGPNPELAWWENDGNQNWTKHFIDDRFQRHCSVDAADFNMDGEMDIVSCGEVAGHIVWWEQDGTAHKVDTLIYGIHTVIAKDIDYDGDKDLLGASCIGSRVAWYENDGAGDFIKHDLGALAGALWLDAADLDMDGDRDLVGGPQGAARLFWWENDGNQSFSRFPFQDPFSQAFTSWPVDMDNDNDTDVIAIGYTGEIAWFENRLLNPVSVSEPSMDHSAMVLYPNPAGEEVTIRCKMPVLSGAEGQDSRCKMIDVFSIDGKMIFEKNTFNQVVKLDVRDLETGLYFIRMRSGNEVLVQKLIIE